MLSFPYGMKIGILLWDLSIQGGCQRQAAELARQLKRLGDEAVVYTVYYTPDVYPDILAGIPVRFLFPGRNRVRISGRKVLGLPLSSVRLTLKEFLYSGKIGNLVDDDLDVLNVHEMFAFVGASRWKRRTGKPVLWMMNEFPGALNGLHPFRSQRWNEWFNRLNGLYWVGKWYEKSIREMDRVAVLDDRISRRSLVDRLGIDPVTVRSGLDLSKFTYRDRIACGEVRPFEVLSNAILFPHRRLEDIADALGILAREGLRFTWRHVGAEDRHPEYARLLRRRIESAGISDRTVFLGGVSDNELVSLYQNADAFVFPSHPQTWGLVVFEAMACGAPVVVSRGAGASEVLTDGENSILVDPCRPDQIAAAIRDLAASSSDRNRLSRAGRQFVETNITWEIYAGKMRNEMKSLCMKYRSPGSRAEAVR